MKLLLHLIPLFIAFIFVISGGIIYEMAGNPFTSRYIKTAGIIIIVVFNVMLIALYIAVGL